MNVTAVLKTAFKHWSEPIVATNAARESAQVEHSSKVCWASLVSSYNVSISNQIVGKTAVTRNDLGGAECEVTLTPLQPLLQYKPRSELLNSNPSVIRVL